MRLDATPSRFFLVCLTLAACTDKDTQDEEECDTGDCVEDTSPTGPFYDEGCTTVDGEGGYLWLNDAIEVASEGAEIMLCATDSGHEELVVVDKAVSIIGPGSDNYILVAPTNEAGFMITADGVSISGISVDSTRSGFEIEGATGTTLEDIQVLAAGNWGVKATDTTDLLVTGSQLLGNGYGGILVDGGTASVSETDLSGNTGYGVKLTGGAEVGITGCTINSTIQDDTGDSSDGVGVLIEDASLGNLSNNELVGNAFINVYAQDADLSMNSDIVTGGLYGIASVYGDLTMTDVDVTDGYLYGVFAVTQTFIDLSGVRVSGDPESTQNVPDDEDGDGNPEWGGDDYGYSGTGLYVVADELNVSDSHVEGYNNAGMLIAAYDSGTAIIENVDIVETGRHGMYIIATDAIVTDSTVVGIRQVEDQGDEECYYVDRYGGVVIVESTLDWQGGEVTGNGGYGFSNIRGSVSVDDTLIGGNLCAGFMNFGGSDVLTGNTFTEANPGSLSASVVEYGNTGSIISGNSFVDNQNTEDTIVVYDYSKYYDEETCAENPGYCYVDTYTYVDKPESIDIYITQESSSEITGNTFENGDFGILSYGSELEITGNEWSNYRANAIQSSYTYNADYTEQIPGEVVFGENTVSGYGGNAVECSYSTLEVSESSFTGGSTYGYSYTLERDYPDDSGYTDFTYEYSTSSVGAMLWGNGCSALVDDVSVSNSQGNLLTTYSYSWPGTYEIIDVTASQIGQDSSSSSAIYAYGYYEDTQIWLRNVDIDGVAYGDGIEVSPYDSTSYTATIELEADGLRISDVRDNGITLTTSRTSATVLDTQIVGAGAYGIYANEAALTLGDATVSDSGSSGIYLEGASASISNSRSTGNAGYGWSCNDDTTMVDECADNDMSGNGMGETDICDQLCP